MENMKGTRKKRQKRRIERFFWFLFMDLWRFEKVVNEIHLWGFQLCKLIFIIAQMPSRNKDGNEEIPIARCVHQAHTLRWNPPTVLSDVAEQLLFVLYPKPDSLRASTILLMDVQLLLIKLICALNWPTVTSNYGGIDEKSPKMFSLAFDVSSDVNRKQSAR